MQSSLPPTPWLSRRRTLQVRLWARLSPLPPLMVAILFDNSVPSGKTIRTNVLKRGPWDFLKYLFALEQADPNRTIHDYFFQHMCIWVHIHNIPLSLMTAALARVLGASVGKVIMTDTRLEDGNMGEFMRVRVLFDTSKPFRRCVVLSRPDAKASMCPLQYERLPLFCHGCGLIGHSVLVCPTTPKMEGQKFQYGAWLRAPLPKRSATRPRGRLSVVDDDLDAHVPGRAITDNILVAHEIVHTLHTSVSRSSQGAFFKLDMEKAFDRVEVRVRGALPEAFLPQRGLRQGDPLSPFLFLFCTEGLSAALIAAQREGRLPGVRASKHRPPVNHLLFADDSLVFLRNDMSEKVNFSKSTAYFSPRTLFEHRLAVHEALGVREVSDPGIYLGVPLLIGKNKYVAFGHYRDKKCPDLFVDFGGQGRARPVAGPSWPGPISVCLKLQGDGFKDLHLFNIALLGKQLWRLLSAPGSLLYRTLRAPDGDLLHASAPARSSFAWKGLHHAMSRLRDGFYWTLGIDSQGDHDSGIYTVHSGYLFLRRPSSPFAPPLRLWKILAKLPAVPKVRSFGWRCGRDVLLVGSRLRDAGLSDGACPLCGSGFEDTLHAIRDCQDATSALRQAGFADTLLSTDQTTTVDWLGFAASSLSEFVSPAPHPPLGSLEASEYMSA
ncbi:hypothetical protein GQ457_13G013810 [Hibiscus cannabinus]